MGSDRDVRLVKGTRRGPLHRSGGWGRWRGPGRATPWLVSVGLLEACSRSPSRNILGSYFPSWMVCALVALFLTVAVRAVLVRVGIDAELPAPLVAYLALFAAFTFATWLIWLA